MKKLFTLVTFALMAVLGANAQTWKQADTTAPEAGAKLIDNDLVTVSTVSATTAKQMQDEDGNPLPVTIGDYTFTHYIQVRTDSPDPNADNPTGGVMDGSTALVVTAKKDADVTFYFRRQKGSAGFDKDDNKDLTCWAQNGAKFQSEEEITEIPGNDAYAYAAKTYKFVEGGIYTIYRRGSTITFFGFDVAEGTSAGGNEGGSSVAGTVILSWNEEPTLSTLTTEEMTNTGSSNNVATWSNGISIMIMRSDKAQSAGSNITVDGQSYKTIKVSNGAQNKLILPEGKVTKKLTLYSYVNVDAATDRVSYWKEVAGVDYTEADVFASYKDFENPDKREYTFDATNEVTFTNTGEQACYVAVVEVEDAPVVALGNRKWDFTKWSDATVANLKADAAASKLEGWSDVEKQADAEAGAEPTETSKDNCFWATNTMTANADGTLSANGVVIEELKGLVFTEVLNSRNLAIAVNYPEALSTYHGGAYLWLGGANKQFFTIPAVAGGSTIKMGVESHKTTDARGVDLLVNGTSIGQFTPTTYDENVWTVPEGETVDVVVDNTNGCHVYFIEVTSDGANSIKEVVKVINNGAVYNLAGQKVDENYKGVVIKNGKKMLQK